VKGAVVEQPKFIPYRPVRRTPTEMQQRADELFTELDARRSVRSFSSDAVPRSLIESAIAIASTAPSGAHRQPWKFVAIDDPSIKAQIRTAAEYEERISYEGGRMPPDWREALTPLGTDWHKPYLELAPWLVVVFEELHGWDPAGRVRKNYYTKESVGIACGLFIAALHRIGLATLTHTPSPMGFLSEILGRPTNERPYILFPIGFPAEDASVPDLTRKPLDQVAIWNPAPRSNLG
jgi:nitroreductase